MVAWPDLVVAAGLLALSLGVGWLRYLTRMERHRAAALPPPGEDPIHELREVNAELQAAQREAAAIAGRVVDAVQAGVR